MSDDLVTQAVAAYEAGDHTQAARILTQVVKDDKYNAQAWYYLGLLQTDPAKRKQCFERALKVDPDYTLAQLELDKLNGKSARPENITDLRPEAPPAQKSRVNTDMAFSSGLLSAIPGAPASVSLGSVMAHVQEIGKHSIPVFSGQAAPSTSYTWWELFLNVTLVSFFIGLLSVIGYLLTALRYEWGIDLFSIIFPPFLVIIIGLAAVGAGSFLSYWYVTKQGGGTGSLLAHSSGLVSVWVPASLILAIFVFIVGILNLFDVLNGGVVSLEQVLLTGLPRMSGMTLVFTILAGGVAVYAMYLMSKFLVTLHGVSNATGWIGAFIMLFVTALVF